MTTTATPTEFEQTDETPTVDDGFHVTDDKTANWLVRKIVESRRYADRVREWAAIEIRRAEREEEFFLFRFGAELEAWCRVQIATGGSRRQSINLPAGTVGFRTTPGNLNVIDEKLAMDWCSLNLPDAIRVERSLAKTALKSYIEATGELPPGLDVRASSTRFYVR